MIKWPDIQFGPINLWSMPKLENEVPLYEKLVYQNDDKSYQLKLVVNEFRGRTYVHIRKYFLSYESEWIASKEGISMEAGLGNILSLIDGLVEIVSHEEATDTVNKYFADRLKNEVH